MASRDHARVGGVSDLDDGTFILRGILAAVVLTLEGEPEVHIKDLIDESRRISGLNRSRAGGRMFSVLTDLKRYGLVTSDGAAWWRITPEGRRAAEAWRERKALGADPKDGTAEPQVSPGRTNPND